MATENRFTEESENASPYENDPGIISVISNLLGFGAGKQTHLTEVETSLFGAPQLCERCEIEVQKWNEAVTKQLKIEAEQEERKRMIYDALACFASGALMGIVIALLQD